MEKPYIKQILNVSDIKVWLVDGRYIRDNIDVEFPNFGQHYKFKYIPKDEFWIDQKETIGEESFYIEHLLIEHKLMSQGMSYEDAITKASNAERRMRKKALMAKLGIAEMPNKEISMQMIKKLQIECYSGYVKVWLVDANLIRNLFYIDFTQGGHDYVYKFVPKNEVWLDEEISERERKFILLHELHERFLMANEMDYAKAHIDSSSLEYNCRQHPEDLDRLLQEELTKNNNFEKARLNAKKI
ncbi:MAG: hypothetical protein KKA65_02880 [Nanoarchaeota archaeon]|nr:hypothetical protein [Nanoarchaeota archaeon]MBU4242424.1 hypothetical protein [Nanoarchaeota archaeon]MBU4351665.1 hypothetical protein [Nanoarchaeota archaeon]MBU4456422.1 hypothetical protein [Nanoarchaeota archaeon]MCG2720044.1 hypothetical protein [Nanoarchaeota archaeon]